MPLSIRMSQPQPPDPLFCSGRPGNSDPAGLRPGSTSLPRTRSPFELRIYHFTSQCAEDVRTCARATTYCIMQSPKGVRTIPDLAGGIYTRYGALPPANLGRETTWVWPEIRPMRILNTATDLHREQRSSSGGRGREGDGREMLHIKTWTFQ